MGLVETNDNTLTGNSIMVGDLIFTWEDDDAQIESKPSCELSGDPK